MKINIKTKHIELSPEIRAQVDKKLSALGKYLDASDTTLIADVELARTTEHHQKGRVFYAEINMQVKGVLYRASADGETLLEALDKVQSEMAKELRRSTKKKRDLLRAGGAQLKKLLRRSR